MALQTHIPQSFEPLYCSGILTRTHLLDDVQIGVFSTRSFRTVNVSSPNDLIVSKYRRSPDFLTVLPVYYLVWDLKNARTSSPPWKLEPGLKDLQPSLSRVFQLSKSASLSSLFYPTHTCKEFGLGICEWWHHVLSRQHDFSHRIHPRPQCREKSVTWF